MGNPPAQASVAPPTVQAKAISAEPPHPMGETAVVLGTPAPPTNFSGLIDSAVESPAEPAIAQPAAQAGSQTMQLDFTNVPGYQQAAAIGRTARQLSDVSNVDVQEFERGRLVLEVQAGDPAALADQMIASAPAAMNVADRSPNAITFQLS